MNEKQGDPKKLVSDFLVAEKAFLENTANAWHKLKEGLKVGDSFEGAVSKVEDLGVLVDIGKQFSGIIFAPDFRGILQTIDSSAFPTVGSVVEVTIVGFNDRKRQVALVPRETKWIKPNTVRPV